MMWTTKGYESAVFYVETAFLYGKLDEEIYMDVPNGYRECGFETAEDEVLEVLQATNGRLSFSGMMFSEESRGKDADRVVLL